MPAAPHELLALEEPVALAALIATMKPDSPILSPAIKIFRTSAPLATTRAEVPPIL
jgi:hypothetical protein